MYLRDLVDHPPQTSVSNGLYVNRKMMDCLSSADATTLSEKRTLDSLISLRDGREYCGLFTMSNWDERINE